MNSWADKSFAFNPSLGHGIVKRDYFFTYLGCILLTVVLALTSVLMRSSTGVIDRHSYGFKKRPLVVLNFLNNSLPALLLLFPLLWLDHQLTWKFLSDGKFILLGLAVQFVAFAFSYAFKHLTVARVNLASRLGDLCIPIALMFTGALVTSWDIFFAALISLSVFALNWKVDKPKDFHSLILPGGLITGALIFQSIAAEIAYTRSFQEGFYEATFACLSTLVWRSFFCLPFMLYYFKGVEHRPDLSFLGHGRERRQLLYRTIFTLIGQLTFNFVLATGDRLIAWPILNAVSIFSVFMAGLFLKERVEKKELVAVILIVLLSILRTFVTHG